MSNNTLEQSSQEAEFPKNASSDPQERRSSIMEGKGTFRVPFQLPGVTLDESHPFSPSASNPKGPTTFTNMAVDDGMGSTD